MANLNCQPVQNLTTNSADVSGTADLIPANHFLRIAYGVTSGGPFNTFTAPDPGTNSPGQVYTTTLTQLLPNQDYYYVLQELDTDGTTILAESDQCHFHTRNYETRCQVISFSETQVTVSVCADYVAPDQTLDFVYGDTPGGPYPNVGGSVVGNNTKDQCATFTLDLDPCQVIYFRGSVTNVPAIYEVDWAYAHRGRALPNETAELRIGPEADYPANQTLVDVDSAGTTAWNHKSGTYAVPLNVDTLHMGFVSTSPPGSVGNFLDSTSIVLRRVLPSPMVIGEQLQNPGFENPPIAPGGLAFVPEGPTPPMVWQTTDPTNVIEQWGSGFLGVPSDSGGAFVELNANNPSELFQVVPLAVLTADSPECVVSTFNLDCDPATGVDCTVATLNGRYCGLPEGYSVQFQYATSLGGPFFNLGGSQFVQPPAPSETDAPVSLGATSLNPGTQYFYRVVALNPQQRIIGTSETCTFTTPDCVAWCGSWWDPNTCELVESETGDYYNCWPEPVRDGFPQEGVEHS